MQHHESVADLTDEEMICVRKSHDFIPHGQIHIELHPGPRSRRQLRHSITRHGLPLVQALRDISLKETSKKAFWLLRKCPDSECDEELYANDCTVVWSRKSHDGDGHVLKSFTVDSLVKEINWCVFLLPVEADVNGHVHERKDKEVQGAIVQRGIFIREEEAISIFTDNGQQYTKSLPFQVNKTWPIKNGLIFERAVQDSGVNPAMKTPQRNEAPSLPIMFSMLHPLDEVTPIICKTGGTSVESKVSYITEGTQHLIFTNEEPSLAMTYDNTIRSHIIWMIRRAKPEEAQSVLGYSSSTGETFPSMVMQPLDLGTPGCSQSASALSRLTLSSQSPGLSPLRNLSSHLNSPSVSGHLPSSTGGHSKIQSPSLSRILPPSRTQSPSVAAGSLYRQHTPSPQVKSSPAGFNRSPYSMNLHESVLEQSLVENAAPLAPEVCFEYLWSDSLKNISDGSIGPASKGFLSTDLCGQQYFCYLIPFNSQLRCVKLGKSNDLSQLIFGSITTFPARDALPIESLNMILVMDSNHNLILYSGISKMNQVHVPGLPTSLNSSAFAHLDVNMSQFTTPVRVPGAPITSSRPPSAMEARFDDSVQELSPVRTDGDLPELLHESLNDVSFNPVSTTSSANSILSLKDSVKNRVTLELIDGAHHRLTFPPVASSPLVKQCLEALKQILPRDVAMQLSIHWYCTQTAPGSVNGKSEWNHFESCLLSLAGYDVQKSAMDASPVMAAKKARFLEEGDSQDWTYLMKSTHHKMAAVEFKSLEDKSESTESDISENKVDATALLFMHLPSILFSLHLVYEDSKLDGLSVFGLQGLANLLYRLAIDLHLDLYIDHYFRDHPRVATEQHYQHLTHDNLSSIHYPAFFPSKPPSVFSWLESYLRGHAVEPFPYLEEISKRTCCAIKLYVILLEKEDSEDTSWKRYLKPVLVSGRRSSIGQPSANQLTDSMTYKNCFEKAILTMASLGLTLKDSLVFGISLPLKEAVYQCRSKAPSDWPAEAYMLIGREDLAKQRELYSHIEIVGSQRTPAHGPNSKEEEDGMEYLDKEVLNLRFSKDLRIRDARNMLQSSRPVKISLTQKPEVNDHDFIEEQERHLYSTCIRTMALPMGRGIFTLSTYHPVPTETLPIPKLCLTGRASPRNTTVDLSHIEVPHNMNAWPLFHNGVAAGLRIANSTQLDSTWIVYNRPKNNDLTNEHAGFLMGLGLNGHLTELATLNVHDYLLKGHEMTSIGILLGVAAGKRGTMDVGTTRLLSIHLAALLPPTSTELNVPHNVQVAAILGIGLVYSGTAHRHIAQVLLEEIGRPPGPEMENNADRESYSLAAGLALGMVMLAKGTEAIGLADLNLADNLYHYMVGGYKKPLNGVNKERYKTPSYQIWEGDQVNIDVTAAGATLALGMMFFNTRNSAVAEWLTAPKTQILLDFVRPDFLMLRIISLGLVMWPDIEPTDTWIDKQIPEIVHLFAFNKSTYVDDTECDVDFETMSQAHCNIVAGACFAIGLKFAGSSNPAAKMILMNRVKAMLRMMSRAPIVEQTGRSTVENCMIVILTSLAMVMAGSGDLDVLRLCRHLRARVGPSYNYVLYGSHVAVSMAIGLLFMGGGRYTLTTKPESIAVLLCSFFPKFPIHSIDNRYHLQAFRHLYSLAAEPRVLLPRDVDTNNPCYTPITIIYQDTKIEERMAPCLLPELNQIEQIQVNGPRYWPIEFHCDKNWDTFKNLLFGPGYLYVKQRAGHLSYMEDPHGHHSILAQSFTSDQSIGRMIQSEDIASFSSDPCILAFAEFFCHAEDPKQEYAQRQMMSKALYECVCKEKPETLATQITLENSIEFMHNKPLLLWQILLLDAFYSQFSTVKDSNTEMNTSELPDGKSNTRKLIGREVLQTASSNVEHLLNSWQESSNKEVADYLLRGVVSLEKADMISSFLTWYRIPAPFTLGSLGFQGELGFGKVLHMLKQCNLQIKSIISLHRAISCS